MPDTLAQKWRTKYPGSYDDMDDASLEKAVLDKHPEYQDLATPTQETAQDIQEQPKSLWDKATSPLTNAPTRFAESVSNYINPNRETKGFRGVGSAFIEGLGGAVSGLTSPLNLATAGLGLGETTAAKAGLPIVAKALNIGGRAASVPQIAEGVQHASNAENVPDFLSGALETGLGVHGSRPASVLKTAKPYFGAGLETTGRMMRKYQPVSGVNPFGGARTVRNIERGVGGVIERTGKRMQETPKADVKLPEIRDAEVVKPKSTKPPDKPIPGAGGGRMPMGPADKPLTKWQSEMQSRKSTPRETTIDSIAIADEIAKRKAAGFANQVDSRISGLPPQETSMPNDRVSNIASRMASQTGPTLLEQLGQEAQRYGLSIEDYVASLRQGDQGFVMPSAEMPRVR